MPPLLVRGGLLLGGPGGGSRCGSRRGSRARNRVLERRETGSHLANAAQVLHQVVELQHHRQEVVARELRLLLQLADHVLEGVHALRDAHQVERRGLALDGVQLAEQAVEFLTEFPVVARRLFQDGVDELQAGLGAVQERVQLQRIDVHHAEHHVQLRVRAFLRLLQLLREEHAGGDIADGAQHVLDALGAHNAVEVELQVAGFLAAVPVLHRNLELAQRVDALHQVLVGAFTPEQLDVLHRGAERVRRHEVLQQVLETEAGKVVAAEHAGQRFRPHRADVVIGVEQEEAFPHRLQNVFRLLLRFLRGPLVA